MKRMQFGSLGEVGRLTLGGGGVGGYWGETSREEGIATIRAAVDAGIDLLDAAPGYLAYEPLIGEAFGGRLPEGVRVTTKCGLGTPPPGEAYARLRASLEKSLAAMRVERADIFFLHNAICADDYAFARDNDERQDFATTWSAYRDELIPAFERLAGEGLIGAWGITGVAVPDTIVMALESAPRPQAVQAVANLLDSPGGLLRPGEPRSHRDIIGTATRNGVAVMAIRAVQAGALTARFDRAVPDDDPDMPDYRRAAPFRELCVRWGEDPAVIAYRYALGMPGVETLVLGVKNRAELAGALAAESAGPLETERVEEIDALGLGRG